MRGSFITGVVTLALAVGPALCCCVSALAGEEDAGCGGSGLCESRGEPSYPQPGPDDQPCPGDQGAGLEWTAGPLTGKIAAPADKAGGTAVVGVERRHVVSRAEHHRASGHDQVPRAGPLVSLQSLRTLLLH